MALSIDNRRDILLLLLYSPGRTKAYNEPIAGRTRLMKMLFLFKEEALPHFKEGTAITRENFYEYFPWNFGPFSRDVYDDLNFFELRGFIKREQSEEEAIQESAAEWERWVAMSRPDSAIEPISEYEEQVFSLTPKGEVFAAELYALLSAEQRRLLKEFKARLQSKPLRAILKYVYESYEDQTTHSRIRERIIGRRATH